MPSEASDHAEQLARSAFRQLMHRHADPNLSGPWAQDDGKWAFDVTICDADDLPSGYVARVVVSVQKG